MDILGAGGRRAPLLDLGRADAHRQRRLSGLLASGLPQSSKEEGCHFQSHIDGSRHLFTPESVIDTERTIGADIMMAFDECPPGDSPRDYAAKSLALTERWLDRCFNRYRQTSPKYGHYQALFPIVQGCTYPDLRARAAENVKQYDADGYAIGGLAVGEPAEVMYSIIEQVEPFMPKDKPRYLMGVGTPVNILGGRAPRRGFL